MAPTQTHRTDVHSVSIRHCHRHHDVYAQVSALNRQIARLRTYVQRCRDRQTATQVHEDARRLSEVRDLWLQVEQATQADNGVPDHVTQLKQMLTQED